MSALCQKIWGISLKTRSTVTLLFWWKGFLLNATRLSWLQGQSTLGKCYSFFSFMEELLQIYEIAYLFQSFHVSCLCVSKIYILPFITLYILTYILINLCLTWCLLLLSISRHCWLINDSQLHLPAYEIFFSSEILLLWYYE